MRIHALIVALMMLHAGIAVAADPSSPSGFSRAAQETVEEATVLLGQATCTGVIVGDPEHVVTAAHCIDGTLELPVRLYNGLRSSGTVERLDRERDVALLRLREPADATPLQLAHKMPRVGDALYFGGRRDRKGSAQVFAVVRIGRCPSLPQVDNAVFTNLRARKGDSGAPLVNRSLEVVALVHGGATCNIAAPVVGLDSELGLDR